MVAAHFVQGSLLRGFDVRMRLRNYPQAGSTWVGGGLFAWIASSSSSNNDFPVSIHRPTSTSMFARVNLAIRVCRLANTVTMILRRFAPEAVLLVRAPLRISASRRAFRSLRLFVGSTSGCSTNTNRHSTLSANSRCLRKDFNRIADAMYYGFSGLATG